jgi:hypothetical protein
MLELVGPRSSGWASSGVPLFTLGLILCNVIEEEKLFAFWYQKKKIISHLKKFKN